MTGEYLLEGLAVPESLNLLHDLLDRVGSEHPDIDSGDLACTGAPTSCTPSLRTPISEEQS